MNNLIPRSIIAFACFIICFLMSGKSEAIKVTNPFLFQGIEEIDQGRYTLEVYVDPIVSTTVDVYDGSMQLVASQSSNTTGWIIFDTTHWTCDDYTIIGNDDGYEEEFEEMICH